MTVICCRLCGETGFVEAQASCEMTSNVTVAVSGMMWLHDQHGRKESDHGTAEERSGPERGGDRHLDRLGRHSGPHRATLRALGTAPAGA